MTCHKPPFSIGASTQSHCLPTLTFHFQKPVHFPHPPATENQWPNLLKKSMAPSVPGGHLRSFRADSTRGQQKKKPISHHAGGWTQWHAPITPFLGAWGREGESRWKDTPSSGGDGPSRAGRAAAARRAATSCCSPPRVCRSWAVCSPGGGGGGVAQLEAPEERPQTDFGNGFVPPKCIAQVWNNPEMNEPMAGSFRLPPPPMPNRSSMAFDDPGPHFPGKMG